MRQRKRIKDPSNQCLTLYNYPEGGALEDYSEEKRNQIGGLENLCGVMWVKEGRTIARPPGPKEEVKPF